MGNKEKELEVEIKGYGCDDDCEQYLRKRHQKIVAGKKLIILGHCGRKYQVNM